MLDTIIRGGQVVDGTGEPGRHADVAIRDGRVVEVGRITEDARRVIDATGLIVAPGFVDVHTHYDAQLFWDPAVSVSTRHGVTSIIAGHCGFTLAPVHDSDIDYIVNMLAVVEGMSVDALRDGVPWTWEAFGGYLDSLDGHLGVNAAFMVGHSTLRRYVMGPDSVGQKASAEQIEQMVRVLHASLDAGAVGLSTTFSSTHMDGDGQPVPSRHAGLDEVLALCEAVGQHEGTWLEATFNVLIGTFGQEEEDLIVAMAGAAKRPINWNILIVDDADHSSVERHFEVADRAREVGGRLVALTMPMPGSMNVNFKTFSTLHHVPGWAEILTLPIPERMAALKDPEVQTRLLEGTRSPDAGILASRGSLDFAEYVVGSTSSPANAGLEGRRIADVAAERGQEPLATLIDIVCEDELTTILWPTRQLSDDTMKYQAEVWRDPRVMIGGSDAGAHLDRLINTFYPTHMLRDVLRGTQRLSLEEAIRLLTDEPAQLFGLKDRGRVSPGYWADLVVFDPQTVAPGPATALHDLPGGALRFVAPAQGIRWVLVNGQEVIADDTPTGTLAGAMLRSGRDTTSATMGVGALSG